MSDSKPIVSKKHPPFSAIRLQGVIEHYIPDVTREQFWGLVSSIQDLYKEAIDKS